MPQKSKPTIVIDILPPKRFAPLGRPEHGSPVRTKRRDAFFFRIASFAVVVGILAAGTFYGVGVVSLKKAAEESAPLLYAKFEAAKDALLDLEPKKAQGYFAEIQEEVGAIADRADGSGLTKLVSLWGQFSPKFKAIPEMLGVVKDVSGAAFELASALQTIKENTLRWIFGKRGDLLLQEVRRVGDHLGTLRELGGTLKRGGELFAMPAGGEYLALLTNLVRYEEVVRMLESWLADENERHFVILFQNPSEIRPSGGFLGSYADLAMKNGGVESLKVWDIYDTDGQLKKNIIPPKQLQGITPRWGARDANWFFDFPTSARKVLEFLEESLVFREKLREFDGLIAVNVRVVETFLGMTGPIELPEYGLTVTADNFLPEIQREVETGADKTRGEPKRILKVLTPILLDRIAALDDESKRALIRALGEHIAQKDIMAFARDPVLQNYLRDQGASGEVAELPLGRQHEYLAVVHANVAGGKTDAIMRERVKLASKIGPDGKIDNLLTIERTHKGANAKDPWYRATNKDYLKVFTPRGSTFGYAGGAVQRTITPSLAYETSGYAADPDLKAIEDTAVSFPGYFVEGTTEFGKTAFGAWLVTEPGATRQFELQYYNPVKLNLDAPEIPYELTYETQSGVESALELLIDAPPGYQWKENNTPTWSATYEDPPARLNLKLTLVPIP